ncbi:MAG: sigma-54 interaction domain-containing protein [Candidatus Rokuibacteriota bacterium]
MQIIVLDEAFFIGDRVRRLLPGAGANVSFAGSLTELSVVGIDSGPGDLLIAHLGGEITAWQLAACLRSLSFEGRVVALVEDRTRPDCVYLAQMPKTTCRDLPPSNELLDLLLRDVLTGAGADAAGDVAESKDTPTFHGIVGRSRQMVDIFSRIEKVASSDASVCIYGESGTGKELIAYAIHQMSVRRGRPFVALDCTAIPEGLMESHLFGHVKGAFTGAVEHRDGLFSLAHTGTLFLDELCELGLSLQAKLLRVVQTREFYKVGGAKSIQTNIRLISATNRDPKEEVDQGTFREDLYFRLAVVMIKVPALRERTEDIPLLVDHFMRKCAAMYKKPVCGIEASALERMIAAPWPGNVRQLENVVEQAIVMSESDVLTEEDVFPDQPQLPREPLALPLEIGPGLPLREVERRYILQTLTGVDGNRAEAARRLGISLRCLQYKLKSYTEASARIALVAPTSPSSSGVRLLGTAPR